MNIHLSDDQMRGLVAGAITTSLTVENRDKLITDAIAGLLVLKKDGYYGTPKSPLADCFETAIRNWATKACQEYIASNPEAQERIMSVVREAFEKAFGLDRASTVERVAGAIVDGLSKLER